MGGLQPAVHRGPAGCACGGENDDQERGDLGGTHTHGGGGRRELLLSFERKIDECVGIDVEVAQFVGTVVKALPKGVARGFVGVTLLQSGLDFAGMVVGGLSGTAGVSGLSGRGPKNAGENGGGVANPGGNG